MSRGCTGEYAENKFPPKTWVRWGERSMRDHNMRPLDRSIKLLGERG
jgi:hypothetical protein